MQSDSGDRECKQQLRSMGINLAGQFVRLIDADQTIQGLTIKDAPVEMADSVIISKLAVYTQVVEGSMRQGVVKGTRIKSGTRYASIMNMKAAIPTTVQIGRFVLRLYCDQNRNNISSGGRTGQQSERRCYRCLSTSHLVWQCDNEIVCRYCSRSGHKQSECDDYKELGLGGNVFPEGNTAAAAPETGDEEAKDGVDVGVTMDDHGDQEVQISDHQDKVHGDSDEQQNNMLLPKGDCKAVIIGDSLVRHVENVGDAAILAKSGLQAAHVEEMLRVAEAKLNMEEVEKVVFHLGINDLGHNKQNPDIVRLNLMDAIQKVERAFPIADVAVATIPPRKGKGAQVNNYNENVRELNKYLGLVTERDDRLTLLNTHNLLCSNGDHVTRKLYCDRDQSGLHLSEEGSTLLRNAFLGFIKSPSRKRQRSEDITPLSTERNNKKGRNHSSD